MIAGVVSGGRPYAASVATDPYWSSVIALLHFEGADLSTTFFDSKRATNWTNFSSTTISTTQYRFGSSSGSFDAGPYIEGPVSSDWALGTGDFTVELFIRPTSIPTGFWYSPIGSWVSSVGWGFFLRPSGVLSFHSNTIDCASASAAIIVNTWHHIAYSRQSGVGRLFIDGVQVSSMTDTQNLSSTSAPRVGLNRTSTDLWRGYVDEMRITKGVSRYNAGFMPPESQFPDA